MVAVQALAADLVVMADVTASGLSSSYYSAVVATIQDVAAAMTAAANYYLA